MNTEKEAKMARDRFVLESHFTGLGSKTPDWSKVDRNTTLSATGVSPDNYDKIIGVPLSVPVKESVKKAARIFSGKLELAKTFIHQQPVFYDDAEIWWFWNEENKCWEMIDEVDLCNLINEALGVDTVNSKERNEILQALKQEGRKSRPDPTPVSWIQFRNGIVDLKTPGALLEASSRYFTVNPIPWNLGQSYDTPTIDSILEQWVGKDYVQTLYEIIAYCLLPDYPIQRIFCFLGDGRNGKSKFLELIRTFIGNNNVCSTELDTLLSSRFEVTRLYKKLVCQMGETNFNELNRTSIIKKLTGGDYIGFEFKNKTPFEGINYAKIIIATNNLPSTSDKTDGFYRRWLLVDFPNKFSEKKDILATIPNVEYDNLALKCVKILGDLIDKREFTNEGSYEERQKRYEDRSNPFDKFFNEYVEENANTFITKSQFLKKLESWCKENRHRIISESSINQKMKEKQIPDGRQYIDWFESDSATKRQVRVWQGIKWK